MRREHDDESGDTRHDATGQRHGCSGDTRRIARIPIGLLGKNPLSRLGWTDTRKRYFGRGNSKTLFSGTALCGGLFVLSSGRTALAPEAVFRLAVKRMAPGAFCRPIEATAPSCSFLMAFAGR
jgi:hypothetical protein